VGRQLALARNGGCQLKINVVQDRISYPDGLVMDGILSHRHVLHVRRREAVVDIAALNRRVGAQHVNQFLDRIGEALGARAYLLSR
jgi:hypothetical protein